MKNIYLKFLIFFFITTSLFFSPLIIKIFSNNSFIIGSSDIVYYSYPMDSFTVNCKKQFGYYPKWNPYLFLGYPHVASITQGIFDILKNTLQIILPVNQYYNLIFFVYIFLSAFFMAVFLYHKNCSFTSALFSGIIYSLSGFQINSLVQGYPYFLIVTCFIPVLLLFIEKFDFNINSLKYYVLFILISSYQLFSGHPQIIYYQWLFFYSYILLRKYSFKIKIKRLFILTSAILFSVGLSFIQLLPTIIETQDTLRRPKDNINFSQQYSYSKKHLIQTIFPDFWGNTKNKTFWLKSFENSSSFFGSFTFILFIINLLIIKRTRLFFWNVVFLLFLFASMGRYTPVFKIFFNIIPGFSMFRGPDRLLIICHISVAVITGFTLNYFEKNGESIFKNKNFILSVIIILIFFISLFSFFYISGNNNFIYSLISKIDSNLSLISKHHNIVKKDILLRSGIIIISLIFLLFYRTKKNIITFFIITITLFDLLYYDISIFKIYECYKLKKTEILNKISKFKNDNKFRILFDKPYLNENRTLYYNINNLNGYHVFLYKDFIKFQNNLNSSSVLLFNQKSNRVEFNNFFNPLFRLTGVKYLISKKKILHDNFSLIEKINNIYLYKLNNSLPLFYNVSRLYNITVKNPFNYIKNKNLDLKNEAVISDKNIKDKKIEFSSCKIIIKNIKYSPDIIDMAIYSPCKTFIVNLEAYNKDWFLFINKKPAELFKVNGIMRGFIISKGNNIIKLRYKPESVFYGKLVSIFSLICLSGLLIYIKLTK